MAAKNKVVVTVVYTIPDVEFPAGQILKDILTESDGTMVSDNISIHDFPNITEKVVSVEID